MSGTRRKPSTGVKTVALVTVGTYSDPFYRILDGEISVWVERTPSSVRLDLSYSADRRRRINFSSANRRRALN